MSTFKTINKNNSAHYSPIMPAAFFVAEPGAQGRNGDILIVSESGEFYFFNFIYGDLSADNIARLCPTLYKTRFNIGGQRDLPPEGWLSIYLGLGNHLLIAEKYKERLIKELSEAQILRREDLYQKWLKIMAGIVRGKDDEIYITMRDFMDECHLNYNPEDRGRRNPNIEKNIEKMFQGPFSLEDLLITSA